MLNPEEKKRLIKMYNDKLNKTFKKAEQGEVINLTELFIEKEMLENTLRG